MVTRSVRLVRKKKRAFEYFYLQHSFRKDGKVVTREKYLGRAIPENIEELKEKFSASFKRYLYDKLELIRSNFLKEWARYPESARGRELQEIAIAFTYNTNAIEGSTITLEETREILEDGMAPAKPIRDVKETESHASVFLDMLKTKEKLSDGLLLKWHSRIFRDTKADIAGQYRNYMVRVGNYIAPDWREIGKLMSRFIGFVNGSSINPVELAAMAHYRFEKIHPFGDGNGRIGRLLMNSILWHNGYPMLVIEHKNRLSYYKALKKSEEEFVGYLIKKYISVHKKLLSVRRP